MRLFFGGAFWNSGIKAVSTCPNTLINTQNVSERSTDEHNSSSLPSLHAFKSPNDLVRAESGSVEGNGKEESPDEALCPGVGTFGHELVEQNDEDVVDNAHERWS